MNNLYIKDINNEMLIKIFGNLWKKMEISGN